MCNAKKTYAKAVGAAWSHITFIREIAPIPMDIPLLRK